MEKVPDRIIKGVISTLKAVNGAGYLTACFKTRSFFVTAITKQYYDQFKLGVTSLLQRDSARAVLIIETNDKLAE